MRIALNSLLGLLTLIYPFAVYYGLQHIGTKGFALLLLALFTLRFIVAGKQVSVQKSGFLLILMLFFTAFVYLQNSSIALRFYPVLINSGLFTLFFYSLFNSPTIIERLARLQEPDLPESGVIYTRKVTIVWCLFFIFNGSIAAYTALYCDLKTWTLYNGLIAYLLMGSLFGTEFIIRFFVKRRHETHA
ncbi:MAG: hypothetical protein HRU20_09710 [Pseudomonadales bacterium]|nr:hypothetical protein [Pseudomonadales bacterium]